MFFKVDFASDTTDLNYQTGEAARTLTIALS